MSTLTALRWRCRRGALELDLLLGRYLESRYEAAPPEERDAFRRLLELQDPEVLDYLTGRCSPPDREMTNLVEIIRTLSAART